MCLCVSVLCVCDLKSQTLLKQINKPLKLFLFLFEPKIQL